MINIILQIQDWIGTYKKPIPCKEEIGFGHRQDAMPDRMRAPVYAIIHRSCVGIRIIPDMDRTLARNRMSVTYYGSSRISNSSTQAGPFTF